LLKSSCLNPRLKTILFLNRNSSGDIAHAAPAEQVIVRNADTFFIAYNPNIAIARMVKTSCCKFKAGTTNPLTKPGGQITITS